MALKAFTIVRATDMVSGRSISFLLYWNGVCDEVRVFKNVVKVIQMVIAALRMETMIDEPVNITLFFLSKSNSWRTGLFIY